MRTFFADVILPLPIDGSFTYRIPQDFEDRVCFGVRVVVPFGRGKLLSGIVERVHETPPDQFSSKYIADVIDDTPIISRQQYDLWKWIAKYYMCTTGEVMAASLPSALRLSGETVVTTHPDFDGDISSLSPKELQIIEQLVQSEAVSLQDLAKRLQVAKIMPIVKSLVDKRVVITAEEIKNVYKPKKETVVFLRPPYNKESEFMSLLDSLNKKKSTSQQADTLLGFMMLARGEKGYDFSAKIPKNVILKSGNIKQSSLSTLLKKGVFGAEDIVVSRLVSYPDKPIDKVTLSQAQQQAVSSIKENFGKHDVVLLHGITGSGKTEIYINLIEEVLARGQQVLYLLPEIALTSQIVNRLRRFFGDQVGVYHSRFNEYERVEIWNRVLLDGDAANSSKFRLILGARSALLLPFSNLGLVIVDEEHDGSYKQIDPAPRYNARDAAVVLAQIHGAKALLGTATPSLESYLNTKVGKYGLVELFQRYSESRLPEIYTVNMALATKRKEVKGLFSNFLIDQMATALENNEQIILFQNRRGYAVRMVCNTCESMPMCKYCDVTLTYHRKTNLLKCHYCGYAIEVPRECPNCHSNDVQMIGFGTEQVEDTLQEIFPDAKIARMDYDTTRSKNAYQNIISDFEKKKTDILVGTQMVTKGLDFDRVGVVGVLNADSLISFPDFRAFEHAFQLLSQVSGRAGRKDVPGRVVIQTFQPHHAALKYVETNDYNAMYVSQIEERRKFRLPPITRMVKITLKHPDENIVLEAAQELLKMLKEHFGGDVMGPTAPLVSRIQNLYLQDFWIKMDRDNRLSQKKVVLDEVIRRFRGLPGFRQVRCVVNVDA